MGTGAGWGLAGANDQPSTGMKWKAAPPPLPQNDSGGKTLRESGQLCLVACLFHPDGNPQGARQ